MILYVIWYSNQTAEAYHICPPLIGHHPHFIQSLLPIAIASNEFIERHVQTIKNIIKNTDINKITKALLS